MLVSTVLAVSLAFWLQAGSPAREPAAAEPATQLPAVETQAEVAEPEEPRVICRTETIVGSRMPSRICMTVEHRDQRRRESRALAQRLDVQNSNRGRIYAPGSRGGE
ncbi:hypothetical protein [Brevundimonas sp.]|uniref:hypothetical protein n=1 Tax=Brevundimonas sp. TaxID=1871086 RepID=UPI003D0A60D0